MRGVHIFNCVSVTHVLITLLFLGNCAASTMVGGWRKQDPQRNVGYLQLAHYAVATQTKGLKNYRTVIRLLEVATQVVAGVNYRLKFTTAPTNCVIGRLKYSPHVCKPVGQENALCTATIYIVPWMNQISVTSYKCSSIKLSLFPNGQVQAPGGTQKGSASTIIKL
uniref:Putative tick salivary cystatin n=1 Tax=Rhipicephalus pulchellus TaxID=72859 RepID=L7LRA7_RHIPC